MKRSLSIFFSGFLLLSLLLSGCSNTASQKNGNVTYQVAPSFREFYQSLGGEAVLGPAISEDFSKDSYECQYTVNTLMCLDPHIIDSSRFFLYPIGKLINLNAVTASTTEAGGGNNASFNVYAEFQAFYTQYGGSHLTGAPLTEVRFNYEQKRLEQYFENVGLYHKFSDPEGTVHLLAYGVFACKNSCQYTPSLDTVISLKNDTAQNQPLLAGLARMGDTSVLGQPLTQPYIAADEMEEQVYTSAVVYAPANDLSRASLRPLPILLGVIQDTPGPQKYDSAQGVVFYPVNGNNGFHVPLVFDKFIASHGGTDISGNPIQEVYQYTDTIFRQCFQNYCLDYHSDAANDNKVQMAPLGGDYVANSTTSSGVVSNPQVQISPDTVNLQVAEASPEVAATDEQKLDILVTQKDNQQPLTHIQADLTITLPDNTQYTATFPETGLDGRASLIIPAMKNLNNGQILVYQVCINNGALQPVCVSGSYLIWGTN